MSDIHTGKSVAYMCRKIGISHFCISDSRRVFLYKQFTALRVASFLACINL